MKQDSHVKNDQKIAIEEGNNKETEKEGNRKKEKRTRKQREEERRRELFPPPRPRGLTRYLSRHLIPVMVQTPSWLISGNETIFMVCTSPPPPPSTMVGVGEGGRGMCG
jgi:hypothetical protein